MNRKGKRGQKVEAPTGEREASWNGDAWMCSCQFVNDARRRHCRKCKKKAPDRELVHVKCFSRPSNKVHLASKDTLRPVCGAMKKLRWYSETEEAVSCKDCKRLTS